MAELAERGCGMEPIEPSLGGTLDFGIDAADLLEDILPEDQPLAPRSPASIPREQAQDATSEVQLDLDLTAAEAGKKVNEEGDEGDGDSGVAAAGRALQAEPKPRVEALIEQAKRAIEELGKTPAAKKVLAPWGEAAQMAGLALETSTSIAYAIHQTAGQEQAQQDRRP